MSRNEIPINLKRVIEGKEREFIRIPQRLYSLVDDFTPNNKFERRLLRVVLSELFFKGVMYSDKIYDSEDIKKLAKKIGKRSTYDYDDLEWAIYGWLYAFGRIGDYGKPSEGTKSGNRKNKNFLSLVIHNYKRLLFFSFLTTFIIWVLSFVLSPVGKAIYYAKYLSGDFYLLFIFINSLFVFILLGYVEYRNEQ